MPIRQKNRNYKKIIIWITIIVIAAIVLINFSAPQSITETILVP